MGPPEETGRPGPDRRLDPVPSLADHEEKRTAPGGPVSHGREGQQRTTAPRGGSFLTIPRRFITSLLLAGIFLFLVRWLSGVRAADLAALLRRSRLEPVAWGLAAYTASYLFRSLRFRTLLGEEAPRLPHLFCVVAVHNLLNQVLPVRTGELSYVVLLRNRFHVASAAGVATLAAARALDALALALYLAAGLLFYGAHRALPLTALYGASAVLAGLAWGAILFLPALAAGLARIAEAILRGLRVADRPFPARLLAKAEEVPTALEALRGHGRLLPAFLWSLCTWFCLFAACYLVLLSFSVIDPETLQGISPAASRASTVDVTVVDGDYTSALKNAFHYARGLLRADANGNRLLTIADAVYLLSYLFRGGEAPYCPALGDANNDMRVNLADVIYLLDYLFGDGSPPSPARVNCR